MIDNSFKSYLAEQLESSEFRTAYEESEREIARECWCHRGSVCGPACESQHHEGCFLSPKERYRTLNPASP